jgi:hypothetical protein
MSFARVFIHGSLSSSSPDKPANDGQPKSAAFKINNDTTSEGELWVRR